MVREAGHRLVLRSACWHAVQEIAGRLFPQRLALALLQRVLGIHAKVLKQPGFLCRLATKRLSALAKNLIQSKRQVGGWVQKNFRGKAASEVGPVVLVANHSVLA